MRDRGSLFDIADKVAVVTGASSGIGRSLAGALARAGAHVVLLARREDRLSEAVASIQEEGGDASYLVCDLGDREALRAACPKLSRFFGTPQILVNAAGINPRSEPEMLSDTDWDQTLAVNLTAPFLLARTLAPAMTQLGWGRIVNIASLQSVRAFPGGMAYGASKGGLAQLTRAMAQAWSPMGVTCNAIAPGFFPTQLTASLFEDPEQSERLAGQTLVGRNGRLEDLHGTLLFLVSPASDYLTGQLLFVDGGFTAR